MTFADRSHLVANLPHQDSIESTDRMHIAPSDNQSEALIMQDAEAANLSKPLTRHDYLRMMGKVRFSATIGGVIGLILGLLFVIVTPQLFRAAVIIAPVENTDSFDQFSSLAQIGAALGETKNPLFNRLEVMTSSQGTARALQTDSKFMEIINGNKDGFIRSSITAISDIIYAVVGKQREPENSPVIVTKYLRKNVRVKKFSSGFTELSYISNDRNASLYVIESVLKAIDQQVRNQEIASSEAFISTLRVQIKNASSLVETEALGKNLQRELSRTALARSRPTFAYDIIDPPSVQISSTLLDYIVNVFLMGILGAIVAIGIKILRIIAKEQAA